jgi:hypothetical protein
MKSSDGVAFPSGQTVVEVGEVGIPALVRTNMRTLFRPTIRKMFRGTRRIRHMGAEPELDLVDTQAQFSEPVLGGSKR